MQKRSSFQTPLVPSFKVPPIPEDMREAADLWARVYDEAFLPAEALGMNWRPQASELHNPEFLVEHWCWSLMDHDRLKNDVMGWALRSLEREQDFFWKQLSEAEQLRLLGWKPEYAPHLKGHQPIRPGLMLERHGKYFLTRFQEWMDARLAFHRLALRLTLFKHDPRALLEPICGNVERLRGRLADWRDVTLLKQQELFEAHVKMKGDQLAPRGTDYYGCEFITWLKDRGVTSGAISAESVNWLCWLQLASPLGRDWEPRECARAVRKMVFGERFRKEATKWWKDAPPLTYEQKDEKDDFVTSLAKEMVSNEFNEFVEDYVSSDLADLKSFTNTLGKQLNEYDIPHSGTLGKPKKSGEVVPEDWENGDLGAFGQALRAVALGESHSGGFDPEAALSDLEKDEPQGWLAARHVTF